MPLGARYNRECLLTEERGVGDLRADECAACPLGGTMIATTFLQMNVVSATFVRTNVVSATFAQTNVASTTFVQTNVVSTTSVQTNVLHAPWGER